MSLYAYQYNSIVLSSVALLALLVNRTRLDVENDKISSPPVISKQDIEGGVIRG